MFSAPLRPMAAYRADLTRATPDDGFTEHDGTWLIIVSIVDRLAALDARERRAMLARYEQALAAALGAEASALPREHPFYWVAELRRALTTSPAAADPDAVLRVLRDLAAEMATAGALELASRVLWVAPRAVPKVSTEVRVRVLLDLGRLAISLGNFARARDVYSKAARAAKRAELIELHLEAQRGRESAGH